MKKIILLGFVASVSVLLVIWGPELRDLYLLQKYFDASSHAAEVDGGSWPRLSDACIGCHGFQGKSQNQKYPSLAGQPAPYIATQLHNFASGVRSNPFMTPLAITLSDAEIKLLADYFAKQHPGNNSTYSPDTSLRDKGEKLVENGACRSCHGGQLMGQGNFPRLAGQGYDYLLAQLDNFAAGKRSEPTGVMKSIAGALSAEERKAIASYLASFAIESK
ncbi:c-type cytochrome [Aquipseudomonas alcaligenes]|uniref:c-type cytochrome n=1 Tax=Aquipseudomonas alcaligenes TaxID=43263 RepID=UPI001659A512|nr:c-type cytochrome [Pseudomonas alcaligenes]